MKKIICLIITLCLLATTFASATSDDQEQQYVPDEVVAIVESIEQAQEVADYYGITLLSYAYEVAVYTTPNPENIVRQSQSYTLMPELFQNRIYTLFEENIADMEYSSKQYHHDIIHTSSAWETSTGEGVTVAIIDTGVDIDHTGLVHAISENRAYNSDQNTYGLDAVNDDQGHGTHVAGIVAATGTSLASVYGVAPNADLLIIKANQDSSQNFTVSSLIKAINYAVAQNADIINMSLGASYSSGALSIEQTAIDNAVKAGVTVICAAGNLSESHAAYPAAYDSAIAVSAVSSSFEFANSYSSHGPEVDFAAPGTSIYSTAYNGGYTYKTGTSMACPIVSGIAALILSENPDYTPEDIREILSNTAMEVGDLGWDEYYGYGIVNAYSAILDTDNLYKVTYYDHDDVLATTFVAPEDCLIEPNNPSGEYDFLAWITSDGSYWDFDTQVTSDIELYADWYIPDTDCYVDDSTVTVFVNLQTLLENYETYQKINFIVSLYENERMTTLAYEDYNVEDNAIINFSTEYQDSVDFAKIFVLDEQYKPLIQALEYTLD